MPSRRPPTWGPFGWLTHSPRCQAWARPRPSFGPPGALISRAQQAQSGDDRLPNHPATGSMGLEETGMQSSEAAAANGLFFRS